MHQESPSLVGLADDPEKIIRGRIARPSMVLTAGKAAKDIRLPKRDDNTRSVKVQRIELIQKEGIAYGSLYLRSSLQQRSGTRNDAVIPCRAEYKIVEVLFQKAFDKSDDRVMDFAKRTVVDVLETCNVDHDQLLLKGALCSTHKSPDINFGGQIWNLKSSKSAIAQVATNQMVVSKIAKAMVTDRAALASIAKFAVEAVKSGVVESAIQSVAMTPLSPHHRGLTRHLTGRRRPARRKA